MGGAIFFDIYGQRVTAVYPSETDERTVWDQLQLLLATVNNLNTNKCVVGVDLEQRETLVAVLKLSTATRSLILRLAPNPIFSVPLNLFFGLPDVPFVGIGFDKLTSTLGAEFNISTRNDADLGALAASIRGIEAMRVFGLVDLAREVCGMAVGVKGLELCCFYGNAAGLTEEQIKEQIKQASYDAHVAFLLGVDLLTRLADEIQ